MTVGLSVAELVTICPDAYSAAADSHALVICTEWDEFAVSNSNNNCNNTLYSSQPEIKAVVQSRTLTHNKELNCINISH